MAITKVTTDVITDSSVTAPKLAADSVITAKIADNAVTAAKIAAGALGDQVAGISSSASATTIAGTLASTGVLTANAGVVVDNITIDGTEIDLSSGDLTIDVAGDIILDADGGDFRFKDAGTQQFIIDLDDSINSVILRSNTDDGDIILQGNDGGSNITALTLDMSEGGDATFNSSIIIPDYIFHTGDSNTYFGFNDSDNFKVVTGGTNRLMFIGSETVFNDSGEDKDFRIESNDHTHMLFVDGGTNRVGINNPSSVTAPAFPFVAWDDDEVTVLAHGNNATYIQRYQTHATAPATLVFDKSRGTQGSPTTVVAGDDISRILFRGYTSDGYYETASIHAEASSSNLVNNTSDIPGDLYFSTTLDGGSPTEKFRITSRGSWLAAGQDSVHGRSYTNGVLTNGQSVSWNGSGTTLTDSGLNLNGIGGNAGAYIMALSISSADGIPSGALIKMGVHGNGFNTFDTRLNQFDTGISVSDSAQISISNSSGDTIYYRINVVMLGSKFTTVYGR